METSNSVTTSLLTLLNVSATKGGKRRHDLIDDFLPSEKLNKRKKSATFADDPEIEISEKENPVLTENGVGDFVALEDELIQDEGVSQDHSRRLNLILRQMSTDTSNTLDPTHQF